MSTVDKFRNTQGHVWLNVASSTHVLKDFVNLDNHVFFVLSRLPAMLMRLLPQRYQTFLSEYRKANSMAMVVQHDCRKPLPLPNGIVDHVLCSHFLEHVFPDEADQILQDFYRVLKEGGTLHIVVPDLEAQVSSYRQAKKKGNPAAADDFIQATLLTTKTRGSKTFRLLEAIGGFGLQHRWMYDNASILERIRNAGFDLLERNRTPSKHYRAGDDSVHVVAQKRVVH